MTTSLHPLGCDETEEWRPIPSWPGYEASSLGRVRSVDRVVTRTDGRRRPFPGRVLSSYIDKTTGYRFVGPRASGVRRTKTVHSLVAEAFLGPRPEGLVIRHLDGVQLNSVPGNLAYGTASENQYDVVRHGRHAAKLKTLCPRRHPLALPNLVGSSWRIGRRGCLACSRANSYCRHHDISDPIAMQAISDRYYAAIMSEVAA